VHAVRFVSRYTKYLIISPHILRVLYKKKGTVMRDAKPRVAAESVFNRSQRREAEISEAIRQEAARHRAVVKNMHRLRALRLARDAKKPTQ